jgi:hypothetical protein
MKFLKVGRVAIITRGRYAGKKVRLPPNIFISPGRRSLLESLGIGGRGEE